MHRILCLLPVALLSVAACQATAQEKEKRGAGGASGSMMEDRAAAKLLEAGDARYEADEPLKAVEVWQSVVERHPRSRVRYQAHMRLGKHYLERERAYDRARVRVEITLSEVRLERPEAGLPRAGAESAEPGEKTGAEKPGEPKAAAEATAPAAAGPGTQPGPAGQPAAQPPAERPSAAPAAPQAPPDDSIHTGVFRAVVPLEKAEQANAEDAVLQAMPGDVLRVTFADQEHRGEGTKQVLAEARCLEGAIGGVRVTRTEIPDEELRVQTQLKTASALTNIANRYKEFGLKDNAREKHKQALAVCEEIVGDARRLGGRVLEETYVQLWRIYFEMDQLSLAAATCQRLQREFPNSGFLDDALLQLAEVAAKQGDFKRSISTYGRLVGMSTSQLRGEAQYGIAQCYEQMAKSSEGQGAAPSHLYDRAFQEYKKVYDQFPQSGRVGEAVAKMAQYYYQQKDYARAIDTFENVLSGYPDAKFMDVILFNYGRCLYRLGRKAEARQKFDQLIAEFPESPLAADAKKISEKLVEGGGATDAPPGPREAP